MVSKLLHAQKQGNSLRPSMLTQSEIESLKTRKRETIAYFQKLSLKNPKIKAPSCEKSNEIAS